MDTTKETKHTPGPWIADGSDISTGNGRFVADCNTSSLDRLSDRTEEDAANAAYIVRAVNSHADLLAACEAMVREAELDGVHGGSGRCVTHDSIDAARAAIAKARA